ncbi:Acyl-CoA dehydrogenase type 2 domain protein [Frankia canadensis]|uniref:Acyl-CoA dehydrogenase type 2 domain protein n=1 Tax=Frankia canadensis TaxID=1836972 RepID=A0A2I2KW11_9ACTN|nr:acyl-CoA dehydrogenase family protein [Frankia canadensis]SNQ49838.1 Acyl-CoA dehydrogenase type 2 domain protein [Frankia canadensis]SOU57128.1 Acyl-CoA dehydrogenase type 2 domain protein [Frankia canadensis]
MTLIDARDPSAAGASAAGAWVTGSAGADVDGPVTPGSAALRALLAELAHGEADRERDGRAPHEQFALIRRARLGALRVPAERGGGGASIRELFETVLDLGAADPNIAQSLRNHFLIVEARVRVSAGGAADPLLDRVVAGTLLGAASSEPGTPDVGQRAQDHATTVTPDGDGHRLDGTKVYSTGNLYADLLLVTAGTPDGTTAQVLVPADRDGILHEDDWDGIGQRLTGSGTTRFAGVRVLPEEFLAGQEAWPEGGSAYPATYPQLWLTAIVAGIVRRVAGDAAALVRERSRTFYHAPARRPVDDPILQETVGYIASAAYAAEALVRDAAAALDASFTAVLAGVENPDLDAAAALKAAQAKVVVDDLAQRAATALFDAGGASAVRRAAQFDRHWRNIRTLASHNPRAYKAMWIGAHTINGTPLPDGSYF